MSASIAIHISRDSRWLRTQRLSLDSPVSLGSSPGCDVVLDGLGVRHAFVMPVGSKVKLVASYGCDFRIGGMPVRETLATDRGTFEVGPYQLEFAVEQDPAASPRPGAAPSALDGYSLPDASQPGLVLDDGTLEIDPSVVPGDLALDERTVEAGPLDLAPDLALDERTVEAGPLDLALDERTVEAGPLDLAPDLALDERTVEAGPLDLSRPPAAPHAPERTALDLPRWTASDHPRTPSPPAPPPAPTPAAPPASSGPPSPPAASPAGGGAAPAPDCPPRTARSVWSQPPPTSTGRPPLGWRITPSTPAAAETGARAAEALEAQARPPSPPPRAPAEAPAPAPGPAPAEAPLRVPRLGPLTMLWRLTAGETFDGRLDRGLYFLLGSAVLHLALVAAGALVEDGEEPAMSTEEAAERVVEINAYAPPKPPEAAPKEEPPERPRALPSRPKRRPPPPERQPEPVAQEPPAPTPRSERPRPSKKARAVAGAVARGRKRFERGSLLDGLGAPRRPPPGVGRGQATARPEAPVGPGKPAGPGPRAPIGPGRRVAAGPKGVERSARVGRPQTRISGATPGERGAISAAVRAQHGGFQQCYRRALYRRDGLAGRMLMTFRISPDGRPHAITSQLEPAPYAPLAACFRRVLSEIRIEREGSDEIRVNYTFTLGSL